MKIANINTTTVSVPLEVPLRHSVGTHRGCCFVHMIAKIETYEGITGLGEMSE